MSVQVYLHLEVSALLEMKCFVAYIPPFLSTVIEAFPSLTPEWTELCLSGDSQGRTSLRAVSRSPSKSLQNRVAHALPKRLFAFQ